MSQPKVCTRKPLFIYEKNPFKSNNAQDQVSQYLKNETDENKRKYIKNEITLYNYQENQRKNNYSNLDVKIITDKKRFWKTVKPNSRKSDRNSKKITDSQHTWHL